MVIFVDANVVVRYLVEPDTSDYERMSRQAANLFVRASEGEIELLTTDAVLSEVAFVLSKKVGFKLPGEQVARLLASLVRSRGMRMNNKQIVLEALQIWETRPSLGFVDSLAAAYGRQSETEVATFDKEIPKVEGVAVWKFDTGTD